MSRQQISAVIILAAGAGTRMKSAKPKVLHAIAGRTLLHHAMVAASALEPEQVVVVVRHERDAVAAEATAVRGDVLIADQDSIPGTGRAVLCGLETLGYVPDGMILVTSADVPLVTGDLLAALANGHANGGNAVTMLTARVPDPGAYGRVVRGDDGGVLRIVEAKDASDAELAIDEINAGIYAFDAAALRGALANVGRDNAQGEVYLTDVVQIVRETGGRVGAFVAPDAVATEGVNDRAQLAAAGATLNRAILDTWMRAGVTIVDPSTTWIDADVTLEPDSTVLPGTQLLGATSVAAGASVGPDSTLRDVEVGANATVIRTHGELAVIEAGATVGPFSYLRPGTVLRANGKIGAFVETKNAVIGANSKVPHLSYVGDAEIGEHSNIGAATIFVNFDGVGKHRTQVGSHVRIGSDNTLIAPLSVGDGAYTGAGAIIRKDVPPGALARNQAPQEIIEGWVLERRPDTESARAAREAQARQVADSEGEA